MVTLRNGLADREFTYGDAKVLPGYIDFPISVVSLRRRLASGISLSYPLLSAPMDTVTESALAIALAQQGGIGVIHCNLSPVREAAEVARVKRYEGIFIEQPLAVAPTTPIAEVARLRAEYGYAAFPVTTDGAPNGRLVGMITKDDYSLSRHGDRTVADCMRRMDRTTTVRERALPRDREKRINYVNDALLAAHRSSLCIVDRSGNLRSLVTRTDIEKRETHPQAARDRQGRLQVLAAVTSYPGEMRRVRALVEAGADGIVIDSGQGQSVYMRDMVARIKDRYPHLPVVAGNIAMAEAVEALYRAGADAVKIGVGPGSICVTTEDLKIGRAQGSAVHDCAQAAHELTKGARSRRLTVIADGGLTSPGDVVLALALGADAVMAGKLFAGTEEACSEKVPSGESGALQKRYRGMGSPESMRRGGARRYGLKNGPRAAEGREADVPYVGPLSRFLPPFLAGLRQSMHKAGARDIDQLQAVAQVGERSKAELDGTKYIGTSLAPHRG